ncbi:MAG: glycerophosphodiester phosphodiesterase [Acidobacteria bacterium]|nr:glycerophosphodiester phosphodiesterase [Acidobacteriota bacterium]
MYKINDLLKKQNKLIVAHRGYAKDFHENTLEAFSRAIELRADMIELDVRKTKDGELITHHDKKIAIGKINELTFQQIIDFYSKDRVTIPRLSDALALLQGKMLLDIELKEKGYEPEVLEIILSYLETDSFILSSFHNSSIRIIKKLNPRVFTGLILGTEKPKCKIWTRFNEAFPIFKILRSSPDFLVPYYKIYNFWKMRRGLLLRKPIIIWTINGEKNLAQYFKSAPLNAITTDDLETALEVKTSKS